MNRETFIGQAQALHNGYYGYPDLPQEFSVKEKIPVHCRRHGTFLQRAHSHLNGHGCPMCKAEKMKLRSRLGSDVWRARLSDKFPHICTADPDESLTGTTQTEFLCLHHGTFRSSPKALLKSRRGCPMCNKAQAVGGKLDYEGFKQKADKVFGGKYGFFPEDFQTYKNNLSKVRAVCPEHGVFSKSVKRLLNGEGCPECGRRQAAEARQANSLAKLLDGKPRLTLCGRSDGIEVFCEKHGRVKTTKYRLRGKFGCPECTRDAVMVSPGEWLKRFHATHKDAFEYELPTRCYANEKIAIVCTRHKEPFTFYQTPSDHADGHGCPMCKAVQTASGPSKGETEVAEFARSLGVKVQTQVPLVSQTGKQYLLDIFLPEFGIYIEYNGLYFHSQRFLPAGNCHKQKSDACRAAGARLIHIFEDDWRNKTEQTKAFLTNLLGKSEKVMARKCRIMQMEDSEAKAFCRQHHLQGASITPNQVSYGLYDGERLAAVMCFTQKGSSRRGLKGRAWELVRYVSDGRVQGGAGRLFKHFVKTHRPSSVVSFSWNHLFTGGMYEKLGFKADKRLPPDYTYVDPKRCRRLHKSGFQLSKIARKFANFDKTLSERENCEAAGYYRIYDCGKTRWLWQP